MSRLVKLGQIFIFFIVWFVILLPQTKFEGKFLLPNSILFIVAAFIICICACVCAICGRDSWYQRVGNYEQLEIHSGEVVSRTQNAKLDLVKKCLKSENGKLIIISMILFLAQVVLVWEIAFRTSWDPAAISYGAHYVAYKDAEGLATMASYFEYYPNNLFITFLYSIVYRINLKLGILSNEGLLLVFLQCMISTLTAMISYKVARHFLSQRFSWVIYGLYALVVGVSPWLVIAYSDSTGLIFPIGAFYLYLIWNDNVNKNDYLSLKSIIWFIILVLVTIVGYKLKPMASFVMIALVIVEGFKLIVVKNIPLKKKWIVAGLYLLLIVGIGGTTLWTCNKAIDSMGFDLDDEVAFGVPHWFMMGLNSTTAGGYYQDDFDYSASFTNKKDRNAANIERTIERVHEYGVSGLVNHSRNKISKVYADGTFGWSGSGDSSFYDEIYPERDGKICPLLRQIYYGYDYAGCGENKLYPVHAVLQTILWFMILFVIPFAAFSKEPYSDKMQVLVISVLGLMVYELLFEAHPRYLFTFLPLYIILAGCGFMQLGIILKQKLLKNKLLEK